MIWELGVSCGLVFVGHARTLWRLHCVKKVADYEGYMDSYDGPLVDRTDPEDITAYHKAAAEDYRRAETKRLEDELRVALAKPRSPWVILPDPPKVTYHMEPWWDKDSPPMGNGMVNPLGRPPMCEGPPKKKPAAPTSYLEAIDTMLRSHQCPGCGLTSYNDKDVKHHYCGACHHFCRDAGEEFA